MCYLQKMVQVFSENFGVSSENKQLKTRGILRVFLVDTSRGSAKHFLKFENVHEPHAHFSNDTPTTSEAIVCGFDGQEKLFFACYWPFSSLTYSSNAE